MKKSLKNLHFNKQVISKLNSKSIKGGTNPPHTANCFPGGLSQLGGYCGNSVPVAQGGIGCHIK